MRALVIASAALALAACGRTEVVRYAFVPTEVDAGQPEPDAGEPEPMPCVPGVISPRRAVPTVMFVVDRSGSMDFDLAGHTGLPDDPFTGPRRWDVLRQSLTQALPAWDSALAMGATLFPEDDADGDFCDVSATVSVTPRVGNSAAVLQLFSGLPSGGTPTFSGLNAASAAVTDVAGAVLVLVTDGEPNCNTRLDAQSCTCTTTPVGQPPRCPQVESCLDDRRTVTLLSTLVRNRRLPTYVIGVGEAGVNADLVATLNAMAVAGGVPRTGPGNAYYSAASQSELSAALTEISARIARCTFLTGTLLEAGDTVTVLVAGQAVPQGPGGWEWVDQAQGRFTLAGQWCDRAIAGAAVRLELACE